MSPEAFCKYVFNGSIPRDIPTPGFSSPAHVGREIWPKRYEHLKALARRALETGTGSTVLVPGKVNLVCLSVDLTDQPSVLMRPRELASRYAELQDASYI